MTRDARDMVLELPRRLKRYRQRPDGTLFEDPTGSWIDLEHTELHHLAMLIIDQAIAKRLDSVRVILRFAAGPGELRGDRLDYAWSQKLEAVEKARREALEREQKR